MELSVEELQKKVDALKAENLAYAQKIQAELIAEQQDLQSKAKALESKSRECQRQIDLKDGKVRGLEDLIKELKAPKDEETS